MILYVEFKDKKKLKNSVMCVVKKDRVKELSTKILFHEKDYIRWFDVRGSTPNILFRTLDLDIEDYLPEME